MSGCYDKIDNALGFSKETASLLTGLSCSNLTKFRKKDVSIDDLKYLTDEDLVILEVGDTFDHESFKKLQANLRRKCHIDTKPRPADISKILDNEHKQLQVFNIYLKYLYRQLSLNKTDYFLDNNKNLKASEALIGACKSVLEEIRELEVILDDKMTEKPKLSSNKIKYSLIAGGISIIVLVYIYR